MKLESNPTQAAMMILVFLGLILGGWSRAHGAAFDHTHAVLTGILQQHVRNSLVDYQTLKKNPAQLSHYLDGLAVVNEKEFKAWPEKQRLAFLINLYNATTLKLILDHYPLKSIKDIGWLLKGPWDQKVVKAFGSVLTLKHLEHKILRKEYQEPRIHFALVCAARGCPPLLNQAFTADKLDAQLDGQGRRFLRDKSKNWVNAETKTIYLSPIFDWFEKDFIKPAGTVQKFVTPYFDEPDGKSLATGRYRIRYTDYDWSLNDRSKG